MDNLIKGPLESYAIKYHILLVRAYLVTTPPPQEFLGPGSRGQLLLPAH